MSVAIVSRRLAKPVRGLPSGRRVSECRSLSMAFRRLAGIIENMGSAYWRVEFIRPVTAGDDRCVLLHGQLEETVGPMTIEMAEAWIDRFDNQQAAEEGSKASKNATASAGKV